MLFSIQWPLSAESLMMGSNLLFDLTDGGTAGIFWGFTITVIASIFIYLSIGEMASMYECVPHQTGKIC